MLLGLVPPLVVTAYAWMASRASRWVGDMLFLGFLGVFSAPLALQLVKLVDPSELLVAVAVLALTTTAVVAYTRWRAVRLFLAFSLVLPVLGLASFLRGAPVAEEQALAAARAEVASPAPVVVVVLDELPLSSLITRAGDIDAIRYPNFARLAGDATWYPNATTVHEATAQAVPAILSGRMTRADALPAVADHPENLFTLLGGSYSLDAHETVTALCPRSLCPVGAGSVVDRVGLLLTKLSTQYVQTALPGASADITWGLWDESLVLADGGLRDLPPRAVRGRVRANAPLHARLAPARTVRVPSLRTRVQAERADWRSRRDLGPRFVARPPGLSAAPAPGRVHGQADRQTHAPARSSGALRSGAARGRGRPWSQLQSGRRPTTRNQNELRGHREHPALREVPASGRWNDRLARSSHG